MFSLLTGYLRFASASQLLPSLMQQLAQSSPELVQLINENQEDFYQLLNALPAGGVRGRGAGGGGGGIRVTPEENEAIERLAALGFDKTLAAQVWRRRAWTWLLLALTVSPPQLSPGIFCLRQGRELGSQLADGERGRL